jgi:hypothetical protein
MKAELVVHPEAVMEGLEGAEEKGREVESVVAREGELVGQPDSTEVGAAG